jgi:hypothetical protein
VLKQSRPQLRTRDAWFSDVSRVCREQEVMEVLHPLLPETVPEVLFADRDNYVFMAHAPGRRALEASLLAGDVDVPSANGPGAFSGGCMRRPRPTFVVRPFRDPTVFVQLRVDPFYRPLGAPPRWRTLSRLSSRAAHTGSNVSRRLQPERTSSPAGGFTLVDCETAHFGDPTMDLVSS